MHRAMRPTAGLGVQPESPAVEPVSITGPSVRERWSCERVYSSIHARFWIQKENAVVARWEDEREELDIYQMLGGEGILACVLQPPTTRLVSSSSAGAE